MRTLQQEYGIPDEPDHSCPTIDQLIDDLNSLRKINDKLRTWGGEWKEAAENLRTRLDIAEKEIEALEQQVDELNGQLERALR